MCALTAKDETASNRFVEVLAIPVPVLISVVWLFGWVPQWWLAERSGETDFALSYLAGWRLRLGLSLYEDLLSVKHQSGLPAEFTWLPDLASVGSPPLLLYLLLALTFLPPAFLGFSGVLSRLWLWGWPS